MKTAVYISVICFFALAVLGFLGASQAMAHNVTCVGDAAHGTACPGDSASGNLGNIIHQLSGLKVFSLAVAAAILVFVVFYEFSIKAVNDAQKTQSIFAEIISNWLSNLRPVLVKKRTWLSILEKRDPYRG